eukprot:g40958.t1
MEAVRTASRASQHHTHHDLTDFVARYEDKELLAKGLQKNKTLRALSMGYGIGPDGAKAIGEALESNKSLTRLDVSARLGATNQEKIGATGAKAFAAAFKKNKALRELSMKYNDMGTDGAKAIGEALKVNRTLTSLQLHNNAIGDEGAQAIRNGLEVNTTLTGLILHDHAISDASKEAIRDFFVLEVRSLVAPHSFGTAPRPKRVDTWDQY